MLQIDNAQAFEVVAVGSFVSPGELQIHKLYPLLREERFPELGVQVMFLENLARELYDKELNLIIPITTLKQDFTDLLNNKVMYCDVTYKESNHHGQHILEILRMNLTQAMRIAVPKIIIISMCIAN